MGYFRKCLSLITGFLLRMARLSRANIGLPALRVATVRYHLWALQGLPVFYVTNNLITLLANTLSFPLRRNMIDACIQEGLEWVQAEQLAVETLHADCFELYMERPGQLREDPLNPLRSFDAALPYGCFLFLPQLTYLCSAGFYQAARGLHQAVSGEPVARNDAGRPN